MNRTNNSSTNEKQFTGAYRRIILELSSTLRNTKASTDKTNMDLYNFENEIAKVNLVVHKNFLLTL